MSESWPSFSVVTDPVLLIVAHRREVVPLTTWTVKLSPAAMLASEQVSTSEPRAPFRAGDAGGVTGDAFDAPVQAGGPGQVVRDGHARGESAAVVGDDDIEADRDRRH